jgi:N-methylhydantoinase B/oxoprolinase/acetone carboxylase alpha subunit
MKISPIALEVMRPPWSVAEQMAATITRSAIRPRRRGRISSALFDSRGPLIAEGRTRPFLNCLTPVLETTLTHYFPPEAWPGDVM